MSTGLASPSTSHDPTPSTIVDTDCTITAVAHIIVSAPQVASSETNTSPRIEVTHATHVTYTDSEPSDEISEMSDNLNVDIPASSQPGIVNTSNDGNGIKNEDDESDGELECQS
jgi:hypothetical protein